MEDVTLKPKYDDGYLNNITAKDKFTPYVENNKIVYKMDSYYFNTTALGYVNPDIALELGLPELRVAKYIVEHVKRCSNVILLSPKVIANSLNLNADNVSRYLSNLEKFGAITKLENCKLKHVVSYSKQYYVLHPKYIWNCNGNDYYKGCVDSRQAIEDAFATGDDVIVTDRMFVDLDYWIEYNKTH